MRSRTRLVAVAALAPLLLTGCSHGAPSAVPSARSTGPTSPPNRASVSLQLAGKVEPLRPGSLTAQDISAAQTNFGLDLMKAVCGADGVNTLISPSSAADALGLLDASAGGNTAQRIAKLLHLPVWSPAVVAAVHDHRLALAPLAKGNGDTLRTSNRVWPAIGNRPTPRYLDDVRTAYGAQLRSLNYAGAARQATDVINAQVSRDTDGLIPRLFDKPLAPITVAVLTNALVLKATWREPFLLHAKDEPFTLPSGATSSVRLMDAAKPAAYTHAGGWQAALLPYGSGTLQAVAILPPQGSQPCALPTSAQLAALSGPTGAATDPSGSSTSVVLPRMHLDQSHDLLKTLRGMGLPTVGDYGGIGGSIISGVVQKDVMSVDELGTVAAGATGVMVEASGSAEPKHALTFDRPFLLLLEDTTTHSPLFLASIGDPSAG